MSDLDSRMLNVERELIRIEQGFESSRESLQECALRNDETHSRLEEKLDSSMRFQMKLRWAIGIGSTIIGAILLLIFHYLPWIWDALPKHGHTH